MSRSFRAANPDRLTAAGLRQPGPDVLRDVDVPLVPAAQLDTTPRIDKQSAAPLGVCIAEAEGAKAVALHARTAAQRYSGQADWSAFARLEEAVRTIPVLGNGDMFSAADAVRMMDETGCDGVVVGRGCLGRPWLFGELQAALRGEPLPEAPNLGRVGEVLYRHAALLSEHLREDKAMRDLRKHMAWYLMGFPVGADLRRSFATVSRLTELRDLIGQLDPTGPFPKDAEGPRGRQGSPGKVALPHGWLDDPDDPAVPAGADLMHSGG